jgi:uncharacterized protein (TIGR00251 family)
MACTGWTAARRSSLVPGSAGQNPDKLRVGAAPGGAILPLHVTARAGRTEVSGVRDGALLVRLAAAPVGGAANAELVELLAKLLDVPRRTLAIVAGERGRNKRVRIGRLTAAEVAARLSAGLDRPKANK